MGDQSLTAEAFLLEGRFEEALNQLRRVHPEIVAVTEVSTRLDFAELFERTGRLSASTDLLRLIRRSVHLTEVEHARCSLLDGLLLKHGGHLTEAVAAFHQAYRFAGQASSLELLCWSQLRLMGVVDDVAEDRSLGALLLDLRHNVECAAIPTVSIAYHVFTAEREAKRGRLAESRCHTDLAESLLSSYPNCWLRGVLDVQESCLCYLEGEYAAALRAAQRALAASSRSGHRQTRLIALADMAAAYLAIGQPARAEACLGPALAGANAEEQIFGLLLETLAEAYLENRDAAGCRASLEQARETATRLAQSRSAWHKKWNLRTQARLLQRDGKWRESLELVRAATPLGWTESGSFAASQVQALAALALARLGPKSEAVEAILALLMRPREVSRSIHGLAVAAEAKLLEQDGAGRQSLRTLARALRILGGTGEASSLVEIVDQFINAMRESDQIQERRTLPSVDRPSWRPTQIVCHLEASNSILDFGETSEVDLVALLGALPDLRSEPRTLGEELLRVMSGIGWIQSGILMESSETEAVNVVTCSLPPHATSTVLGRESVGAAVVRVGLGVKRGRRYELHLIPSDSSSFVIHCGEVARLVTALVNPEAPGGREASDVAAGKVAEITDDERGLFRSPVMVSLLKSAKRVAPLKVTILLTGESGTGKEVIATQIHHASGVKAAPFVAFNCATIPRDMLESQLFGYRRGAFTGAIQSFQGVVRAAEGGTLFLDEIGELPLEVQPKLLRFLDTGEIQPLGEALPRPVAVRVIAATNADLETMMKQGRFREDLYYRLNVVHLRVPPLRERRDEIGPFLGRFLTKYSEEFGKPGMQLSDEAREHLLLYSWPGNVRQLSHEMRRLAALHDAGATVDVGDLRPELLNFGSPSARPPSGEPNTLTIRIDTKLPSIVREVELAALNYAIRAADGKMDLAARNLGLSRKGLYLKRHRLGITGVPAGDVSSGDL
jgi:DNA-binding NtrC family response regulator/tetratricopeptide (TPR) repeat protein